MLHPNFVSKHVTSYASITMNFCVEFQSGFSVANYQHCNMLFSVTLVQKNACMHGKILPQEGSLELDVVQ